ncbi:MAG TPA: hypothetical protein VNQ90_07810 [Chthoniobacteraceae bacterium]|nr:hypothetical protein [Chthoniobacteraceae bacterium]
MAKLTCGFNIIAALVSACSTLQAANIVDWQGNYSSNHSAWTLPAAQHHDETRVWIYSPSSPVTPAADYLPPAGKSGPFYGGFYLSLSSGSSVNYSNVVVQNNGTGDYLRVQRAPMSGITLSGAAFVAFQKHDFLDGADNTLAVALDSGSSLEMSLTLNTGVTGFHWAIRNGDQWYVSQVSYTTLGEVHSLAGNLLLESQWGAWSPTGGDNQRLGDLPATFNTTGESFTDIQGFGYFALFESTVGGSINSGVEAMRLNATVAPIPEPSTLAFILGSGCAFLFLGRWRRSSSEAPRIRKGRPSAVHGRPSTKSRVRST